MMTHTYTHSIAGAYTVNPVTEASSGARALQISSGCPRAVYWAGSMAWDLAMHLAVSVVSLATFAAFGDVSGERGMQQLFHCRNSVVGYGDFGVYFSPRLPCSV